MKVFAGWLSKIINIVLLHEVVHDDFSAFHLIAVKDMGGLGYCSYMNDRYPPPWVANRVPIFEILGRGPTPRN